MTSLSDDEFDSLVVEKAYVQNYANIPRWHGKPWQLQESFIFKLGFQSACLFVNLVGLTTIVLILLYLPRNHIGTQCGLATDSLLGDIGWHTITMESEQRFIEADPDDFDNENSTSIWNDIYPSAWIWVADPSKLGFGGGVKLVDYAEDPSQWNDKTEGFSIAVMHQLHCVAELKRSLIQYRRDGATVIDDEHLDHCVEYLRQAVMCHSDLTLERPEDMTYPHGSTGWGDNHRCRDWSKVVEAIREHALDRGATGWKRLPKTNLNDLS